jgi:DNA polymerase-3 subunit epsilon
VDQPLNTLFTDPAFAAMTYVVIDFEGTTPKGHRPEPIEVAALALTVTPDSLAEIWRFEALMKPPAHAPVTAFDTAHTGISAAMVADQPPAAVVLADLDARITPEPHLLIAHNAPTEAGLLHDYRDACPILATTDLLDTVRLARRAFPELSSHRLDALLDHLAIPHPPGRHRAMPDVEVTAHLFIRLVSRGPWRTLQELRSVGGFTAKANRPSQESLFE